MMDESCKEMPCSAKLGRHAVLCSGKAKKCDEQPLPFPLLRWKLQPKTHEIVHVKVVPEAMDFLRGITTPLKIVSIMGQYRSGKSFFMDNLLGIGRKVFTVGDTVNPQTEEVMMYVVRPCVARENAPFPLGEDLTDSTLIALDTPGLFAPNRPELFDAQLLALMNLLSTTIVYNTINIIDRNTVEKLSLAMRTAAAMGILQQMHLPQLPAPGAVKTPSSSVWAAPVVDSTAKDKDLQHSAPPNMLAKPSLLWAVQNFHLELRSQQNEVINPTQWFLELIKESGVSEGADGHAPSDNDFVTQFETFFRAVGVATLPFPVTDLDLLPKLKTLDADALQPKYTKELNSVQDLLAGRGDSKYTKERIAEGKQMAKGHAETVADTRFSSPKFLGGQRVDGEGLAALLMLWTSSLDAEIKGKGAGSTAQADLLARVRELEMRYVARDYRLMMAQQLMLHEWGQREQMKQSKSDSQVGLNLGLPRSVGVLTPAVLGTLGQAYERTFTASPLGLSLLSTVQVVAANPPPYYEGAVDSAGHIGKHAAEKGLVSRGLAPPPGAVTVVATAAEHVASIAVSKLTDQSVNRGLASAMVLAQRAKATGIAATGAEEASSDYWSEWRNDWRQQWRHQQLGDKVAADAAAAVAASIVPGPIKESGGKAYRHKSKKLRGAGSKKPDMPSGPPATDAEAKAAVAMLEGLEKREQDEEWDAEMLLEGGDGEAVSVQPGDLVVSVNGHDVSGIGLREVAKVVKSQSFPIVLGFVRPQYQFVTVEDTPAAALAAAAVSAEGLDVSVLSAAEVGSGYAFTALPVRNKTLERAHEEATKAVEASAHLHSRAGSTATKAELEDDEVFARRVRSLLSSVFDREYVGPNRAIAVQTMGKRVLLCLRLVSASWSAATNASIAASTMWLPGGVSMLGSINPTPMSPTALDRILWQYVHGCRLLSSASNVWSFDAEHKRTTAGETEGGADGVATSSLAAKASFERAGGWGPRTKLPTLAAGETVSTTTPENGAKNDSNLTHHKIDHEFTHYSDRRRLAGEGARSIAVADPSWVWSWSPPSTITPAWVRQTELAMAIPPRALLQCALSEEVAEKAKGTKGFKAGRLKAPWLVGWREESLEIGRLEPGWARGAERAFVAKWASSNRNNAKVTAEAEFVSIIDALSSCLLKQDTKVPLASEAGAREKARAATCGGQAMLTWAAVQIEHPEFSDDDPASTFERTFTEKPFGLALRATSLDADGTNLTKLQSWAKAAHDGKWSTTVGALAAAHENSTVTAGAGAVGAASGGLWWGAAILPPLAAVAVKGLKASNEANAGVLAGDLVVAINGRDVSAMSLKGLSELLKTQPLPVSFRFYRSVYRADRHPSSLSMPSLEQASAVYENFAQDDVARTLVASQLLQPSVKTNELLARLHMISDKVCLPA
jgi:hypothetical protein